MRQFHKNSLLYVYIFNCNTSVGICQVLLTIMIIINFTYHPIIKAEVMIMIIKTADRIKSSRENLAVTQAELARKLSVTRACVNAWEMGISIPLVGKDGGACRGV